MDVEGGSGQSKLRRRDRVRQLNQARKGQTTPEEETSLLDLNKRRPKPNTEYSELYIWLFVIGFTAFCLFATHFIFHVI